MAQNEFLKQLYADWVKTGGAAMLKKIKQSNPDLKAADLEVIGYETYGVIRTKEDREALALITIDYSEPTLLITYV